MDPAGLDGARQLSGPHVGLLRSHAERPQARVRREAKARRICQSCPVVVECRQYARENREFGIWGGESEEDRARHGYAVPWPLRDRRRAFQAAPSPRV